jgi:hypothetical protein
VDELIKNAMASGRENFDTKSRNSHIPEIQLYNELKQFYQMFQTQETDERLDMLEQVAILIEDKIGDDIAMDVVGSVNVGLSSRVPTSICPTSDAIRAVRRFCPVQQYRAGDDQEILARIKPRSRLRRFELGGEEHPRKNECETTQWFVSYRARPPNHYGPSPAR